MPMKLPTVGASITTCPIPLTLISNHLIAWASVLVLKQNAFCSLILPAVSNGKFPSGDKSSRDALRYKAKAAAISCKIV